MSPSPQLAPQYVADVSPVRELSLWGSAALPFWQERLESYGLHCTEKDGQARVMISAAAARFKGIAFREVSFSVAVCRERGGEAVDGFFLLHAFNSVRLFAFVERTLFSTPYYFAQVEVEVEPHLRAAVKIKQDLVYEAVLGGAADAAGRTPQRIEFACWEGPLFLPGNQGAERRLFLARLEGDTEYYAFDRERDLFRIESHPAAAPLGWLVESQFTPQQWLVRRKARHAKSKTVRRIRALGFDA